MNNVRILLVDDHEVVRRGTRAIIEARPEWEVCAEAATGQEAIALTTEHKPNVAVLDIGLPDMNGVELARQIRRASAATEVMAFSGSDDPRLVREFFEAGARSYVFKADGSEVLLAAITAVATHKSYFTDRVSKIVFAKFIDGEKGDAERQLTPRERQIVQLLADGMSNKEVAAKLGISLSTAETHRAAVMRKLRLSSLAELVRYAIRQGIVGA